MLWRWHFFLLRDPGRFGVENDVHFDEGRLSAAAHVGLDDDDEVPGNDSADCGVIGDLVGDLGIVAEMVKLAWADLASLSEVVLGVTVVSDFSP